MCFLSTTFANSSRCELTESDRADILKRAKKAYTNMAYLNLKQHFKDFDVKFPIYKKDVKVEINKTYSEYYKDYYTVNPYIILKYRKDGVDKKQKISLRYSRAYTFNFHIQVREEDVWKQPNKKKCIKRAFEPAYEVSVYYGDEYMYKVEEISRYDLLGKVERVYVFRYVSEKEYTL